LDRIPHGEAHFYQGMFIRCQSYHGDYACPFHEVEVSGGDETGSNTQVPIVEWVGWSRSVERVVGAVHSTGGRIGTHMLLWVPPRDLVVRTWG
jgi:hypothetical protein